MDDFDYLLAWGEALQDLATLGPFLDGGHEVPGHPEINVGLQQGAAHLSQGLIDVLFGQAALAGQPVKDSGEFFGQGFQNVLVSLGASSHLVGEDKGEGYHPHPFGCAQGRL